MAMLCLQCICMHVHSENGETPVSAAVRKGKDDILQYLLNDCKYSIERESKV